MLKLKNVLKPPIFDLNGFQGSQIKGNFNPDRSGVSDWRTVVGNYVFLTKNIDKRVKYRWKLVKNSSKYTFFVNHRFHSVLRLILTIPFERASKNLTIDTLRQPFRAKLEVSIPNPPTELQLCFPVKNHSPKTFQPPVYLFGYMFISYGVCNNMKHSVTAHYWIIVLLNLQLLT